MTQKSKSKYWLPGLLLAVLLTTEPSWAVTRIYNNAYEGAPGVLTGDTHNCQYSTDQNHTPGGSTSQKCSDDKNIVNQPHAIAMTTYASMWYLIPTNENLGIDCRAHMYRQMYDSWNWQVDWVIATSTGTCDTTQPGFPPMLIQLNVYGPQNPNYYLYGKVTFQLITGGWVHVETLFTANTDGQSNGSAAMWVNGVAVLNTSEQKFLTDGWTTRTNAALWDVEFPSNFGMDSLSAKIIYGDDLEVYDGCPTTTLYAGTPSCTGAPLAAPASLVVR